MNKSTKAFVIGAAAGTVITTLATDVIPKMMIRMMQGMMNQMGTECNPSEM